MDISVALKWVVREDFTDNALALRDDRLRRNDPIHVPPLLLYEATNVLYDVARHRYLTDQQADQAVADIAAVVTIVPAI
ncbi:MAG: type II toxin-antitoxin system VapC family toxin [Chloroflexota bacterium]|nr:type II toxin-antitoxin system VapC family toxin [Chloroflexota bacterium]